MVIGMESGSAGCKAGALSLCTIALAPLFLIFLLIFNQSFPRYMCICFREQCLSFGHQQDERGFFMVLDSKLPT